MEILSGHQWAAVKVPDDCYAVIPNMLSIDSFDLKDKDSYLCSPELESFLEKNQLIVSYPGEVTHGKKRTYYKITEIGRNLLEEKKQEWLTTKDLVDQFLEGN